MDGVFPENLHWLEPYYLLAKPYLKRHKLIRVHHAGIHEDKMAHIYGACITEDDRNYKISIYTEYYKTVKLWPLIRKRKVYSTIDILNIFAHELAHINHWEHTTDHKILECKIMTQFMKFLERTGYISEEDELA
jgi:hypothetical protein